VSAFAHPAFLAATSLVLALAVHPGVRSAFGLSPAPVVLAVLAILVLLSLVARGRFGPSAAVLAGGALVLLAALAWDGARGQRGALSLGAGEGRSNFVEKGLGGRSLGLRPLGLALSFEGPLPGGGARLRLPAGPLDLAPDEVVSLGGFRLGPARISPSGEADAVVVAVTGGGETREAEVRPDAPGTAFDLSISLERYFPDFALDEKQQPYTRSNEPRNPGALLVVERAGKRHRVFVLQSMPGLHRVDEIGRSFALRSVEPGLTADIGVHREPAAPLALIGALVVAAGVGALAGRGRAAASGPPPSAGGVRAGR
jgi:hypothetical protein